MFNMAHHMKHKKISLETTDDSEEEDIQQPQIYAKDSLDRFGDDMCGLLLSYLSLEDRFRFECMSKQFQRTVFGSVVDITLSDRFMHKLLTNKKTIGAQMLATIAIKCSNIQTIDCRGITNGYVKHIPEVLHTFRDNCRHLSQIYCHFWGHSVQTMRSFGPLVTRIGDIDSYNIPLSLIYCDRLSRLRVKSFDDIFCSQTDELFASNLHTFEVKYYLDRYLHRLFEFVAHNQCLKSFVVRNTILNTQEFVGLCGHLSQLPQLRDLTLNIRLTDGQNSLNDSLRTISLNCKQLKRLSLTVYSKPTETIVQTLDLLKFYPQLKRLHLRLVGAVANVLLDPLKHCKRLTHLELDLPRIDINLFQNVDKNYLRLHYLCIKTAVITRKCLHNVSRLPALQILVIKFNVSICLSSNSFSDLLTTCPKLKTIETQLNNVSNLYLRHMAHHMKHKKISLVTTDDSEEEDRQLTQIYAKDSLDRFGDDMFGLLLSYLLLEDRFRCECVSKQFRRIIFGSVEDIILSDGFIHRLLTNKKRIDTKMLATIAIKCPNIECIDCRGITIGYECHIPEVLNTFQDNCWHLRDIYCNLWRYSGLTMGSLGPLVTRIGDVGSYDYPLPLIRCHRLSHLCVKSFDDIFRSHPDQLFVKNLHKLEVKHYSHKYLNNYLHDYLHRLSTFVAHNQCLNSLIIRNTELNTQEFVELCGQLSRLPLLRDLTLNIRLTDGQNSLDSSLRTIAVNCKQLKRLSLTLYTKPTETIVQTLGSLRLYPQLKRLHLTLIGAVANVLLDPLKHCKRLTHLELDLPRIDINLFENLDKNYLRLHYLWIRTTVITRECLAHISRLPALQTLVIHFNRSERLSGNGFGDLLTTCPKLKTIETHLNNVSNLYLRHMAHHMKHKKISLEATDDGEEEDRQQPQIYGKDSLDRFGDDMFGLLLSYLSSEDRFRCECVSKQFQRTVFGSIVDIRLSDGFIKRLLTNEKTIDAQMLATIAIKCSNIQCIDLRGMTRKYEKRIPEVLNTFRDNCRHLKEFYRNYWRISGQTVLSLRPLVTRIDGIDSYCWQRSFELCVNSFDYIFWSIPEQLNLSAKNLHTFEVKYYLHNYLHRLSEFVAHNQCLKSFVVRNTILNTQVFGELCGQLSRLPQLRDLTLNIRLTDGQNSLNDSLLTISVNCKQLKRLSLTVYSNATAIAQTLDSFGFYPQLKRFHLTLIGAVANGLLDPLKHCKRLTHLVLDLPRIDINLFQNVDKNYLSLHYLCFKTTVITSDCLSHISRLPALQTLVIYFSRSERLSDMAHHMKHKKISLVTTDDGEEEDIQQTQIYAKDSLDRFGDDMFGLLLSHLSFEDRFRFECVSKQIQRTVFESVVDIILSDRFIQRLLTNEKTIDSQMLATFAIKCSNIQCIDCRGITTGYEGHIPEVLNTFRNKCRHLREIYCNLWENNSQTMRSFGPLITRIGDIDSYYNQLALSYCHRLSRLRIQLFNDILTANDQLFAEDLDPFEFNEDFHEFEFNFYLHPYLHRLSTFVAHNQSLKSLIVGNTILNTQEFGELCGQLSRLPLLRELIVNIKLTDGQISLNDSLLTIAGNCKQLKRLSLTVYSNPTETITQTLDSLGLYSQLKRLHLTFIGAVANGWLDSLKDCKRLTHLELNFPRIDLNLFQNMDQNYLRLHYLSIKTSIITRECLAQISRLPALQTLVIEFNRTNRLSGNGFSDLLTTCPKLKTIETRVNTIQKFYS
ncbi:unnamed protein product [Medioppia subpectinata]|uniref:F-box domain-containing protein n=1 Tax=Medioppia subpectinata TaxID=1979941 RepID=A0A7R9KCK7_9ACAR|nr:unnamed protein product [Medioppia subpectinata]CAG2100930.1 unnamed protein product [Medioppia subpectinata]